MNSRVAFFCVYGSSVYSSAVSVEEWREGERARATKQDNPVKGFRRSRRSGHSGQVRSWTRRVFRLLFLHCRGAQRPNANCDWRKGLKAASERNEKPQGQLSKKATLRSTTPHVCVIGKRILVRTRKADVECRKAIRSCEPFFAFFPQLSGLSEDSAGRLSDDAVPEEG